METITDIVTITELSRLTKKSRPTVYKWIALYESGNKSELPGVVAELFDLIVGHASKSEIYRFCEDAFIDVKEKEELREIYELIRKNKDKLDLNNLKNIITEEINK